MSEWVNLRMGEWRIAIVNCRGNWYNLIGAKQLEVFTFYRNHIACCVFRDFTQYAARL